MRDPYLTPPELVFRSMIAASEAGRFEVRASEREVARALDLRVIERIVVERPNLAPNGFWAPDCFQTLQEFHASQDKMLTREFLGQFGRAVAFVAMCCGRRKAVNRKASSYGLKHAAERAMRELGVAVPYVSNGAMICAAIALGYRVERIPDTPNAFFNMRQVEGCR